MEAYLTIGKVSIAQQVQLISIVPTFILNVHPKISCGYDIRSLTHIAWVNVSWSEISDFDFKVDWTIRRITIIDTNSYLIRDVVPKHGTHDKVNAIWNFRRVFLYASVAYTWLLFSLRSPSRKFS